MLCAKILLARLVIGSPVLLEGMAEVPLPDSSLRRRNFSSAANQAVDGVLAELPTFAATMRLLPFTTPSDSGSAEPVEPASIAVIIFIRIIERNVERTKGKGDLEPTEPVHLPHPRGVASTPPIHTRNRGRWKPVRSSRTGPWSWARVVFLSLHDPCESSIVTVLCQLARPYMGGVGWCGGWWGGWAGPIILIYTYVLVSQFEDELIGFPNIPTS